MNDFKIKFHPLGGLGQIGSNMMQVLTPKSNLIIDAGILFPNDDFFDIDYLIPDYRAIIGIPTDIIITHGHEDHIGAISHFCMAFPNANLWASSFTAELINAKLSYAKIYKAISIFEEKSVIEFKDIEIHPIHVNHSIPQTFGLLLKDKKNDFGAFYVSDFKVDKKTKYEAFFNFKKLNSLSKKLKHRILLPDSTNITSKRRRTLSESDLIDDLKKVISAKKNRIFITTFSSNLHRIQTIINIATKEKRWLIPYGRSMVNYIEAGLKCQIIKDPKNIIKQSDDNSINKDSAIILLSGCQGDFYGTFRRVSYGHDKLFVPDKKDTFIISSKAIPGNEKNVNNVLNQLAEIGVEIYTSDLGKFHASGHAGIDDLQELYDQYEPHDIIPIHGETIFIRRHIKNIKKKTKSNYHFLLNYHQLIFKNDYTTMNIPPKEEFKPLFINQKSGVIEKETINERRKLATQGTVLLSSTFQSPSSVFKMQMFGLPKFLNDEESEIDYQIAEIIAKHKKTSRTSDLEEKIRVDLRRFFVNKYSIKPIVFIHFL
ncbi:MAG: ribonuclease J [Halobacteriovoraceae bacterium]|nr:ribonuclease J [Halobacteriovoraceae bacterium]